MTNSREKKIKILGISEGHNSSAAIMIDGKILACASEERFSRLKSEGGYPKQAIDFCLTYACIEPDDLDCVVLSGTDLNVWWSAVRNEALFSVDDRVFEQHEFFKKYLIEKLPLEKVKLLYMETIVERNGNANRYYDISGFSFKDSSDVKINQKIRKRTTANHLGIKEEKIEFVDHHDCHIAHALFSSPYRDDNTLIATMDSVGDRGVNATLSVTRPDGIIKFFETTNCQWARIYKFITLVLGMKVHEHEYKVMGLAPYANIKEMEKSYPVFDEILKVNGLEFEWNKKPKDLYFHFRERFEGHRFDGIAGALQKKLEESVTEWITNALAKTGAKNMVFGGGLAMNVKLNLAIANLPGVKKFFVGASPSDESNSMGACYSRYYRYCKKQGVSYKDISPIEHVYLGSEFDYVRLLSLVEQNYSDKYEIKDKINDSMVAQLLSDGKIVARCIGRMEFGARTLGNRSILADASKVGSVKRINRLIKHRDFWMPFAPSIMEDHAHKYLKNKKNLFSDYMTLAFETKVLAHKHLLAAIHSEDLTARPQIVRQSQNPEYYNFLKEFYNLTGMGGLLNTSLNLHGHPIVCSPEDLLFVLGDSYLEYVYVKDHLICKK